MGPLNRDVEICHVLTKNVTILVLAVVETHGLFIKKHVHASFVLSFSHVKEIFYI